MHTSKIFKSFVALVCVVGMASSTTLAVMAEKQQDEQMFKIVVDGKECVYVDGKYYLDENSEEYIQIVVEEPNKVTDQQTLARLNSRDTGSFGLRATNDEIDISDGYIYEGYVDFSDGDYESPMFKIKPPRDTIATLTFKTGFVFNVKVTGKFYFYVPTMGWYDANIVMSFNLLASEYQIITDSFLENATKCWFEFYEDGTDKDKFYYTFYQKDKNL